jgi:hypothetical protein
MTRLLYLWKQKNNKTKNGHIKKKERAAVINNV